jgi:hypothetical protein
MIFILKVSLHITCWNKISYLYSAAAVDQTVRLVLIRITFLTAALRRWRFHTLQVGRENETRVREQGCAVTELEALREGTGFSDQYADCVWVWSKEGRRQMDRVSRNSSFSTALQPFGPWPPCQFLNPHTVGRAPWKGDQPVARPLPTHRTTRTQTSMPRVGEDSSCLRLSGHCDRRQLQRILSKFLTTIIIQK